jgi:MFS family permease
MDERGSAVSIVDEQDVRYEGWRVAAASGAATFFSSFLVYTFAVFLTPLTTEFAWSRELVASAFGLMGITVAAMSPVFGYLLDRVGILRVALPCMAALGLAFVSLSLLAGQQWQLYATYTFFGIVGAGLSPTGYARAVSAWFEKRRGIAIAIVISGSAVAAIVQPPVVQAVIDRIGWRSAYAAIGVSILAIACPTLALFVRERPAAASFRSPGSAGASLADGLRSSVFWTLVIVFFASAVATNGVVVHLAALLTDRGVQAGRAALVISTMGAASLAGRLATGWLVDRFFATRVSFVMLSLTALGTFLLAGADSFAAGALAAGLIGFGMGGEYDVTPYLLSRYFGLRAFGTLYGIAFAAAAAAGAVGPVLLGRAFDATGSYESLLPKLALFVVSVALLMLTLPRYDVRMHAQSVAVGIE